HIHSFPTRRSSDLDREPFHASPNACSLCLCLNALQRLSHIRLCIRKGGGAATIFHGSRHTTLTSSFPVARRPRSGRVEVVHGPFVSYTHPAACHFEHLHDLRVVWPPEIRQQAAHHRHSCELGHCVHRVLLCGARKPSWTLSL